MVATGGTYAVHSLLDDPDQVDAQSVTMPSWSTPSGLATPPAPSTPSGAAAAVPAPGVGSSSPSPRVPPTTADPATDRPTGGRDPDPTPASPALPRSEGAIKSAAGPRTPPTSTRPDVWIKENGARLSQVHVKGNLYLTGNDVTVQDVVVDGDIVVNSSPQGVLMTPVPADVVLRNVKARGIFTNGFNGLTLDAVELANTRNAPHAQLFNYADPQKGIVYPASRLVVQNSWLHGLRPSTSGAHMENLHLGGIQGAVIRNNVLDLRSPDGQQTHQYITANLMMQPHLYGVYNSNIVIENNWFRGGGSYQIYVHANGSSRVANNRFFSDSPTFAGVQYPPSAYEGAAVPPGGYRRFNQSGNTLDGKPLPLPGGR